jgi:hypothetical protein
MSDLSNEIYKVALDNYKVFVKSLQPAIDKYAEKVIDKNITDDDNIYWDTFEEVFSYFIGRAITDILKNTYNIDFDFSKL